MTRTPSETVRDTIDELANEAARRQFANTVDATEVDVDRELADAWFITEMGKQSPQQLLADMVCELTDAESLYAFGAILNLDNRNPGQTALRSCIEKFIATAIARDATLAAEKLCEDAADNYDPTYADRKALARASSAAARRGFDLEEVL